MLLRTPPSCENGTRSAAAAEKCEFVGEVVAFPACVIFASVGSLMIVGGVVGNSMLLVVPTTKLFGHKTMGTHTLGLFISNLAVADISSLLNWPVLLVLDMILGYHPVFNKTHCVATAVIGVCCHIVSCKENRPVCFFFLFLPRIVKGPRWWEGLTLTDTAATVQVVLFVFFTNNASKLVNETDERK